MTRTIHDAVDDQLRSLDILPRKQTPTLPTFRYSVQFLRDGKVIRAKIIETHATLTSLADSRALSQTRSILVEYGFDGAVRVEVWRHVRGTCPVFVSGFNSTEELS